MSAYFMHTDPEVYPDPLSFKPERWLGDRHPNMMRNFVPFARGKLSVQPFLVCTATTLFLVAVFACYLSLTKMLERLAKLPWTKSRAS
jgi:hypothetical protein